MKTRNREHTQIICTQSFLFPTSKIVVTKQNLNPKQNFKNLGMT